MYYLSKTKSDLEDYNTLVTLGEHYDGVTTVGWAKVIEHPNSEDFAILKHNKYEVEGLTEIAVLDSSWFPDQPI